MANGIHEKDRKGSVLVLPGLNEKEDISRKV